MLNVSHTAFGSLCSCSHWSLLSTSSSRIAFTLCLPLAAVITVQNSSSTLATSCEGGRHLTATTIHEGEQWGRCVARSGITEPSGMFQRWFLPGGVGWSDDRSSWANRVNFPSVFRESKVGVL